MSRLKKEKALHGGQDCIRKGGPEEEDGGLLLGWRSEPKSSSRGGGQGRRGSRGARKGGATGEGVDGVGGGGVGEVGTCGAGARIAGVARMTGAEAAGGMVGAGMGEAGKIERLG